MAHPASCKGRGLVADNHGVRMPANLLFAHAAGKLDFGQFAPRLVAADIRRLGLLFKRN
jgi:hypothetical protein